MRALVLHGVNDLRFDDVPAPDIPPGWVRVRVAFCGVCGSDLPRLFVKGAHRHPIICGHEFAGTVEALGPGVEGVAPGDRVTAIPLIACGKCPACAERAYARCENYDYLGSRRDGAFAESVVAPARNLLKVPDGVGLEAAAMTEPAAVARHALRRMGDRLDGKTVAIFGAGPIGLIVAQWARAMGARAIALQDPIGRKLDMARSLGFETTVPAGGADMTVDAAGAPAALLAALRAVRRGGHVVLLGNPSGDLTLPAELWSRLMRWEATLHGTWNSDFGVEGERDDWRAALAAMKEGRLDLAPLISHRVPLSEAMAMLRAMRDGRAFYSKVLIQPSAPPGSSHGDLFAGGRAQKHTERR